MNNVFNWSKPSDFYLYIYLYIIFINNTQKKHLKVKKNGWHLSQALNVIERAKSILSDSIYENI